MNLREQTTLCITPQRKKQSVLLALQPLPNWTPRVVWMANDAPEKFEKQIANLNQVKDSFAETATPFSFEFDASPNFHARSINTNHGWKISLDRGLDIFQWFESSAFNAATNLQEARLTKGCEVSFIRVEKEG